MWDNNETYIKRTKKTYLLRQLLVSTGVWSSFFMLGLNVGAPTVLVPQLRNEANSTEAVTPEQASWLAALTSYSGIPWVLLLPVIAAYFGRKIPYTIVCISTLIGYIIFYFSSDVKQVLISEVFQGAGMASYCTIAVIIITEYSSSEYRGLFLTIKSATFFWGILTANFIGTFFHWKNIPLLGLACTFYCLITVYFWPESPQWLVTKGHFDKTAESHRWLKGSSENSEKELYMLLAKNEKINKKVSNRREILEMLKTVPRKEFYKPVLLSMTLIALHGFSGKMVCTVYALDILKKITNSTSTAYAGMLILDAVTVSSMYIGCALSKKLRRRFLLLTSSTIAVVFLFSLSLYLFLVKLNLLFENKYVSISLLVGYSIAIACGPMILSSSITGELIPLKSRSMSMCAAGLTFKIVYGTILKVAPYGFKYFGMHGIFFCFGILSAVLLVVLYYYLPETKDKTLQEIEDGFTGNKLVEEDRELLSIVKNSITIVPKFNRKKDEVL